MRRTRRRSVAVRKARQDGMALLVTSLVLVLVGLLAVTALRHSEQESTSGARSRSSERAMEAAEAGVQLALGRLGESPPNLNAFDIDLAEAANVQSRARSQSTPRDLDQVGLATPAEGYAVNVGAGVTAVHRVFLVRVTGSGGGSTVELEAKLGRSAVEGSGY